ncbi:hypothetical protein AURDEDRAFT_65524 [Auricularia subglabra TFB-10046 SS5]|nr:hypothetical protein AURDEDRAFT_65524 [Auricularia subglabra TFB-10046 SS5]
MGSLEEAAALQAQRSPMDIQSTPTEFALDIPLRGGRLSKARVYKPSKPLFEPSPLFVYVFGGGFVIGEPGETIVTARSIVEATGAIVVAPDYRLAPASPFPAAPNDVWDAFTWLAEPSNAAAIGADVFTGLVIGGVSAGGNLAAVTAQRYVSERAEHQPALTGVMLLIPFLMEPELVPEKQKPLWFSREQNQDALVLNAKDLAPRTHQFIRPVSRKCTCDP